MTNQGFLVFVALSCLLLGLFAGWHLWAVKGVAVETYAPAIVQAPTKTSPYGSVVAERKPDANAKPKQPIPKGAKVERVMQATIETGNPNCPSVVCASTLVSLPDGSKRVVFSSPDGKVTDASDNPMGDVQTERSMPWRVGAAYTPMDGGRWGAVASRDFGPVSVGGMALQADTDAIEPWVTLTLRF